MKTYTIYISPKEGVVKQALLSDAHAFGKLLQQAGLIEFYAIHVVTDTGNFTGLPQLIMSSYFNDQAHMDSAMAEIGKHYVTHPVHQKLMHSVSDFKVSFTDVSLPENALEAV